MSALPKAVQEQIRRANEAFDAQKAAGSASATPPAPPPAEPPAAAATPPAPPAPPPPAAGPAGTPIDWEQRYRVLQGKYNAEVPRLTQQLQQLQQQVQMLSAARPAAPPAPPAPPQSAVRPEEEKEFGADLIDLMRRVAREQSEQVLTPELDRRLAPVTQQVQQVSRAAESAASLAVRREKMSVMEQLSRDVPGWEAQNEDAGFLAWLGELDPYAGRAREDLLQEAFRAHDGPRVVAFFKGYQREHAVVTPPAATPPATPPAAPSATPAQRTLEDFTAPGAPKAGTTGAQDGSNKRVFTRKEIKQFYDDCAAGKYKDPARKAAREREIFEAQREGRVR